MTAIASADRIEVRTTDSVVVKTVTDAGQIRLAGDFIRRYQTGWKDPISGIRVPALMLTFFKGTQFVGGFGIGANYLVSDPPSAGFWSRDVAADEILSFRRSLGIDELRPQYGCGAVPRTLLQEPRIRFDETYTNETWGFAVKIPSGMTAYSQSSPPYHGVWFVLGAPPHGSIVVSGEANSLEFTTPRAAALDQLRMLREEGKQIESSSVSPDRLAGLPAARLETTYRCAGDPTKYMEIHVLVLRSRQDPVYDIVLETSVDHAREDRAVFDRVLRNWQFVGR